MSTRWPPMLGVVGFDGGHRPTISLALRPLESQAEEQQPILPSGDVGACCIDGVCSQLTEDECLAEGGTFEGVGVPCDANPCGCPCIEFSGVQFCCIEDVNNEYYEDVGTNPFAVLNGRSFCLAEVRTDPCLYCTNDDACNGTTNAGGLSIFARDCTTHDPAGGASIFLDVATIAGVRYVRAYPSSGSSDVFYFGTDAGNLIESCGGTINIDGPFTDCVYGGPIGDLRVIGFGGTVSLASCPPRGACCIDPDCFVLPEVYCGNVGGTYIGDDVPCTPDPCGFSPPP